jgi:hypothetical protein
MPRVPARRDAAVTRAHRQLAPGLVGIAGALAAVSLLGPFATDVVDYRVTQTLRNQLIGLDAVSLFLVAPVALVAAVLVLRGHVGGFALALGSGAYTVYMSLQYVLGRTTRISPETTSASSRSSSSCSPPAGSSPSPPGRPSTSRSCRRCGGVIA